MKILFDHQEPFLLAHGGMEILVGETMQALRDLGVEAETLRWWDNYQKGDIIHCLGRPSPSHIRFAHNKGIKYVMHELLTAQGSRPLWKIRLQGIMNSILRKSLPRTLRQAARWESYQLANAILASTTWEAKLMRLLYGAPQTRLHVVPTGVHPAFFEAGLARENTKNEAGKLKLEFQKSDSQHPKIIINDTSALDPRVSTSRAPLVTVATITERKMVVELAQAAIEAAVPLTVIGKPYSESDPYYVRFLQVVKMSNGQINYAGSISEPALLASMLQSARGFVLLSTMETQSTAAIAAAATGCPLLLADLPWARCTFGDTARYVPATSSFRAPALRSFYDCATSLPPPCLPSTWREVAGQLVSVYHGILA
ncbi:MAG: hypothetical protein WCG52_02400 [bacterium]